MVSGRGCMSRVACVALSMLRVDADARGITHVSYLDVYINTDPFTLSPPGPERGRSTTPLGPTLPSLVTAREYRSYCGIRAGHL